MRRFTIFAVAYKPVEKNIYDDVTVVLPTLNEAENIGDMLTDLEKHYPGIKIIVVDDGSWDSTVETVRNFGGVELIDRRKYGEHGLTLSVLEGISQVKTPFFVVMDADFQHPVEKVEDIITLLRCSPDLAVGCRESSIEGYYIRKTLTYLASCLGRLSLFLRGSPRTRDVLSGFFGGRTSLVQNTIREKKELFELGGYKVLFDILKMLPKRAKISEVGYGFHERKRGVSKMSWKIIWSFFKALFR